MIIRLLTTAVLLVSVAAAHDPWAGDFSREHPLDVRVLTWNTEARFIEDPDTDPEFNRILIAIDPDVIVFQEIDSSLNTAAVANRLNAILPTPGGWKIHFGLLAGTRNAICSRYALDLTRTDTTPASSTRGVTIARVNLPAADYPADLYVLGVHLKCCGDAGGSEDESRQRSSDAIANWLGDARGEARPAGNFITLPLDTPMVVLGDFNFVGGPQPAATVRTGDIQDEATFGGDVKGDWDVSNLTDLIPSNPFNGATYTWQGGGGFPASRLDRIYYTDAAVDVGARFVLNTFSMTPAALAAAGLQSGDTLAENASDHLPVVADFRIATPCPDADGDGVCDADDVCPGADDALDTDGDAIPDGCDCAGDVDNDGVVGLDDLLFVLGAFGQPGGQADQDGDGSIDLDDLLLVLGGFGGPCPG